MDELYYEEEIPEILSIMKKEMNIWGWYAVTEDGIQSYNMEVMRDNWIQSLKNKEMNNPLIDYKAYLLFEFLFIPTIIKQSTSYWWNDTPVPLYCFKRGSKNLTRLWKQPPKYYYTVQKTTYYEKITSPDYTHIPSSRGELEELLSFIDVLRKKLDIDVVDRDLDKLGLSFDSLTSRIFVKGWCEHPDKDKYDKVYGPDDWMNHAVL